MRSINKLACRLWGHQLQQRVRQAGNSEVAVACCFRCGSYTITRVH
ncbi:hypothetical protein LCGC14_1605800 [marine sediment metagenome]|uniref:Uncharacterized protein n=1 Tax=marine sediment metagenome TaxID=412755 RepID=A0A0F9I9T5_9ZZZZ